MAVLAVLIPALMLGVVLALGRYEEWLLPNEDLPDLLLQVPPAQQPVPPPVPQLVEAESTVLSG